MSGGELPPGWVEVALADLAGLQGVFVDGDWVESKDQDPAGDVRLVQLADVGDGFYRDRSSRFMTLGRAKELRCTFLNEGDVLISRMADPLGRACIFPGDERPCVTVVDVAIMRSVAVDHGWLVSGINSPQYRARIQAESSGTTRGRISRSRLGAIGIACPPLNEQRRIVAKLDELRARSRKAREALDEVPALLEKLKQSVLAAAFRGDLTAEWRAAQPPGSVEPASVLLDRIRAERRARWEQANPKKKYVEPAPVDTEGLPDLPEGWCWAPLEHVAEVQLGQRRAPEYVGLTEYPYIRAANITWRGLDLSDVKTMGFGPVDALVLVPGDILLTEASGSPTEVGKAAIWRGEIDRCCFQATVLRVRPEIAVTPEWLHYFCIGEALLGKYIGSTPGIGILHLTSTRMKRWPVPICPNMEQKEIAKALSASLGAQQRLEDASSALSAHLESLDQSILAQAFRGDLVPQDPTDEPAEALLARVREATVGATQRTTRAQKPARGVR